MTERQQLLRPVLARYTRRFAVLDLGSGDSGVSHWIQQEFHNAAAFTLDRTAPEAMMHKDMTPRLLERLASKEYFSVVLTLNFLHHFWDQDWRQAVAAVTQMGRQVVIQLPPIGDYRAAGACIMPELHAAVEQAGGQKIGYAWYESFKQQRPIWLITNNEAKLIEANRPWKVVSDALTITKTRLGSTQPWIPGMNMWNMIGLGGSRTLFAELVRQFQLPEQEHGDIYPWNFIYDGKRLHLIDPQDEPGGHRALSDAEGLANTLRMIQEEPNNDWMD